GPRQARAAAEPGPDAATPHLLPAARLLADAGARPADDGPRRARRRAEEARRLDPRVDDLPRRPDPAAGVRHGPRAVRQAGRAGGAEHPGRPPAAAAGEGAA